MRLKPEISLSSVFTNPGFPNWKENSPGFGELLRQFLSEGWSCGAGQTPSSGRSCGSPCAAGPWHCCCRQVCPPARALLGFAALPSVPLRARSWFCTMGKSPLESQVSVRVLLTGCCDVKLHQFPCNLLCFHTGLAQCVYPQKRNNNLLLYVPPKSDFQRHPALSTESWAVTASSELSQP